MHLPKSEKVYPIDISFFGLIAIMSCPQSIFELIEMKSKRKLIKIGHHFFHGLSLGDSFKK